MYTTTSSQHRPWIAAVHGVRASQTDLPLDPLDVFALLPLLLWRHIFSRHRLQGVTHCLGNTALHPRVCLYTAPRSRGLGNQALLDAAPIRSRQRAAVVDRKGAGQAASSHQQCGVGASCCCFRERVTNLADDPICVNGDDDSIGAKLGLSRCVYRVVSIG